MKLKLKTQLDPAAIIVLLTFLVFLGFFGLENYMTLLMLGILALLGLDNWRIAKSAAVLLLILMTHTVIYVINYNNVSLDWLAKNCFNPVIMYLVGYWLAKRQSVGKISSLFIIGFLLHGGLNVVLYWIDPDTLYNRTLVNIWGGEMAATLQNLLLIPIAALLFYFLFMETSVRVKIMGIAGVILGVYCTLITASRTLLYIMAIAFFIGTLVYTIKFKRKSVKIWVGIIILALALVIAYAFDILGIRSWVELSELYDRVASGVDEANSVTGNVRWDMALTVLKDLFDKPFGKIDSVNYAHNLYLDMAKFTGFLPALALFIWTFQHVISFFRTAIVRNDPVDNMDIAIFLVSISLLIVFFLEPILEGLPIVFAGFCYLCGIMDVRKRQIYLDMKRDI